MLTAVALFLKFQVSRWSIQSPGWPQRASRPRPRPRTDEGEGEGEGEAEAEGEGEGEAEAEAEGEGEGEVGEGYQEEDVAAGVAGAAALHAVGQWCGKPMRWFFFRVRPKLRFCFRKQTSRKMSAWVA